MNKLELRKLYKSKRNEINKDQIRIRSLDILRQLKETTIFSFQTFHVFLPIDRYNEIDTWFIIEFLKMNNKIIIISKSDFVTNTLKHYVLEKDTVLINNKYGIPEPIDAKEVSIQSIDVVFVPLLISDINNHRVGYGNGFYDRFLVGCDKEVITIGLSYFMPVNKIDDLNKYDIPLDKIIISQVSD